MGPKDSRPVAEMTGGDEPLAMRTRRQRLDWAETQKTMRSRRPVAAEALRGAGPGPV